MNTLKHIFKPGYTFGDYTVLEQQGQNVLCRCQCGTERYILGKYIAYGGIQRCRSCRKKYIQKQFTIHGRSCTTEYSSWANMMTRCYNANYAQYKNYGGRGIIVCKDWHTFAGFYADMGDKPDNHSLDRIDNNGIYCKDNCRWATRYQQNTNQQSTKRVEINGEVLCLKEACRKYGAVKYPTALYRFNKGYSLNDALGIKN